MIEREGRPTAASNSVVVTTSSRQVQARAILGIAEREVGEPLWQIKRPSLV